MNLTTHLHLVSRLTMCGSVPPLVHTSPCVVRYLIKHKDTFTFTVPFHFQGKKLDPILSEPIHNELHYIEMPQ